MSSTTWYTETTSVLYNLAQSMIPVQEMVTGASYLMGLSFAFKAVLTLKAQGEQRSSMGAASLKEASLYLIVAAMLLYFPTALEVFMDSTFGYSTILAYGSNTTFSSMFGDAGASLTIIIQTIGMISFVRGWVIIARSASQGQGPGSLGKGLMHVFGGMFGMNIVGTVEVVYNTLFGT